MKRWKYITEEVIYSGSGAFVDLPDDAIVVCAFEDNADTDGGGEVYIAYLVPGGPIPDSEKDKEAEK